MMTDVLMLGLYLIASLSCISVILQPKVLSKTSVRLLLTMTRLRPLSSSSSGFILSIPQKSPKMMSLVDLPSRKRQP